MIIDADNREGFTNRQTGKTLTQKDIDAALEANKKVFVSFFGGALVEVVGIENKTKYFSSFTDK